jgi:hypothetical protein
LLLGVVVVEVLEKRLFAAVVATANQPVAGVVGL